MASLARYHALILLVESAQLTPIEHDIWRAFLDEAVDSEYAACYIWERIHDRPDCSLEQALHKLKIEWKRLVRKFTRRDPVSSQAQKLVEARDSSHCLMLDQRPSDPNVSVRFDHVWVIPPNLFDDSDMDPQGSLYPLLQAFLTPARTSELQTILQINILESQLRNLFLLSPSVHSAFRDGHIRIFPPTNTPDQWNDETEARIKTASEVYYLVCRLFPEPCGWLFLSDGSRWDLAAQMFIMESQDANKPLPDPFLLRMHHRIAASLDLILCRRTNRRGLALAPFMYVHLNIVTQKILRSFWHLVPHWIRVQCYSLLLKLGSHLYPRCVSCRVHRLPFGLYAKECTRSANEGEALKLLERYTSIPAPLWVDEYQSTRRVLIMTGMPGQMLDAVFHRLSYSEREQLSKDLKSALSQLRSIPNKTPYRFGNTLGGPLFDYRFPSGICGPFNQISEFNSFLVHKYVLNATRENIAAVHARAYRSVFTHADLSPSNILIDHERLSAIVDWECAGFYPEYWEFTKLFYGAQPPREIQAVISDAFTGDTYEEELEAERLLWCGTPFGV